MEQDLTLVTAKAVPGGFDGCWEVAGVDPDLLDPVLLVFAQQRAAQKAKYGGEFFPTEAAADPYSVLTAGTGGTQTHFRNQREFETAMAAIGVQGASKVEKYTRNHI